MRTSLKKILKTIWIHFTRGDSVEDTKNILLPLGYYRCVEVCTATIEYWFERFKIDFEYFKWEEALETIGPMLSLQFLMALRKKYPNWTLRQYTEAIRLPPRTVLWYKKVVDKLGHDYVWPKFQQD